MPKIQIFEFPCVGCGVLTGEAQSILRDFLPTTLLKTFLDAEVLSNHSSQ